LAMRTTFSFTKYAKREQTVDIIKKVLNRVQAQPGVVSASIAGIYPLEPEAISAGASAFSGPFLIEGRQINTAEAPPVGNQVVISNDYFRTLGIPLLKGREFSDTDDGGKERQVVIINEAMQRQFWPNEDPIGKRVSGDNGETWVTIVGVVGHRVLHASFRRCESFNVNRAHHSRPQSHGRHHHKCSSRRRFASCRDPRSNS
jgi:putative ABC transport system permease protein